MDFRPLVHIFVTRVNLWTDLTNFLWQKSKRKDIMFWTLHLLSVLGNFNIKSAGRCGKERTILDKCIPMYFRVLLT